MLDNWWAEMLPRKMLTLCLKGGSRSKIVCPQNAVAAGQFGNKEVCPREHSIFQVCNNRSVPCTAYLQDRPERNYLVKDRPSSPYYSALFVYLDWKIIPLRNLFLVTDASVLPIFVTAY